MKVGGDRFAQRQNANRGCVAVVAIAQSLDRRLDNEIRRPEVRLAYPEIDDIAALGREFGRARQHGKSVLFANTVESGNRLEHESTSTQLPDKGKHRRVLVRHHVRLMDH